MKKIIATLIAGISLISTTSLLYVGATDEATWDNIENSFFDYAPPSTYSISEVPSTSENTSRMFRMMFIDANTFEATEAFCSAVKDGDTIMEHSYDSGMVYEVLNDVTQYKIYQDTAGILSVDTIGELSQYNQHALTLDTTTKSKLQNSDLNLNQTTAQSTILSGFSIGILFSDGNVEYYMPTMDTQASINCLEVGKLYTKDELINILESQQARFSWEPEYGEDGNPLTGGYNTLPTDMEECSNHQAIITMCLLLASAGCFYFANRKKI